MMTLEQMLRRTIRDQGGGISIKEVNLGFQFVGPDLIVSASLADHGVESFTIKGNLATNTKPDTEGKE